jgi:hypothetical protein
MLAAEIIEDIRHRADRNQLDPDHVMLDVLVGLISEMADAPVELADLVQSVAEAARTADAV